MTPGETSLFVSRRARRPRNQSSQLIGRSIGIEGTSDFKFISYFIHERFTLRHITVFRALRNAMDLGPVHLELPLNATPASVRAQSRAAEFFWGILFCG